MVAGGPKSYLGAVKLRIVEAVVVLRLLSAIVVGSLYFAHGLHHVGAPTFRLSRQKPKAAMSCFEIAFASWLLVGESYEQKLRSSKTPSAAHKQRKTSIQAAARKQRNKRKAPTVGLEPTTTRLRALRSTD